VVKYYKALCILYTKPSDKVNGQMTGSSSQVLESSHFLNVIMYKIDTEPVPFWKICDCNKGAHTRYIYGKPRALFVIVNWQ